MIAIMMIIKSCANAQLFFCFIVFLIKKKYMIYQEDLKHFKYKAVENLPKALDSLVKAGRNMQYPNSNENKVLLLTTMFKNAKQEVKIFTNNLSDKFFGDTLLLKELELFLIRGVNSHNPAIIEIVCRESEFNKDIVKIIKKFNTKALINVYLLNEQNSSKIVKDSVDFIVVDGKMFRFQADNQYPVCNFNDVDISQLLLKGFELLIKNSTEIDL